jgi:hypothetical protein
VATLTATMEDTLPIRASELRAMIEDPPATTAPPSSSRAATSGSSAVSASAASAAGSGHDTLDGASRTFSFTVEHFADATVRRELEPHARQTRAFGHLRIDFLRRTSNTVYASGRATQASIPVTGAKGIFAAQDDGEGENAPPDRRRFLLVEGLGFTDPTLDCRNTSPPLELDVERGNVQVAG